MKTLRPLDLIPVPSALGAPDPGTAVGPEALRRAGLATVLENAGRIARWQGPVSPSPLAPDHSQAQRWAALNRLCTELADRVGASLRERHMPVVVGGDHAIALGTWRGMAAALPGPLGLLWIDAHLDAHTPEDSATANPHGMPVALLLGDGDPPLAQPTLNPAHLCLVGARSWELPEIVRLHRYGVRVFDDGEIRQRGLGPVLAEALAIVSQGTAGFGLSLDLDVFTPQEAPGVNTPEPGGCGEEEWRSALAGLACREDCLGLELVECDGLRDSQGRTAALACRLMTALFTPQENGAAETLED